MNRLERGVIPDRATDIGGSFGAVPVRYVRHQPEPWEIGDAYPIDHPLCGAINYFFYAILSLRDSFRKVTAGLDLEAESAKREWDAFLASVPRVPEVTNTKPGDLRFAFDAPPVKQPPYLRKIRRHYEAAHLAETMSYSMLLSLVAQYEAFLGQLLRCVLAVRPQLLKRSEKALTWAEIVDLPNMEEIGSLYVEREIEDLLHRGHVDQLAHLEGRIGVDTLRKFDELGDFVEIMERRNLVAHTGSKISIQYVRQCAKFGGKPGGKPGDFILVDDEYFMHACNTIIVVGIKLAQTVWRHVIGRDKHALVQPDSHLAYVTYTLLVHEDWELAQRLLHYATQQLKTYSSEQRKYVFVINYAQTFKWLGKQQSCDEVLEPYEWGTLDIAFRISHAVLKGDFEEAGRLMTNAGSTQGVARTAFDHWPIYREFRQTPEFAAAYERAFGSKWPPSDLDSPRLAELPPPDEGRTH